VENDVNILVADDERMLRRALSRVLSRAGHRVVLAEDGQQAVDIFAENQDQIDLVILDMNMPNMDGFEAFTEIVRIDPTQRVVISSGENASEILSRFPEKKPLGVLEKPFIIGELLSQIRSFLD